MPPTRSHTTTSLFEQPDASFEPSAEIATAEIAPLCCVSLYFSPQPGASYTYTAMSPPPTATIPPLGEIATHVGSPPAALAFFSSASDVPDGAKSARSPCVVTTATRDSDAAIPFGHASIATLPHAPSAPQ